MDKKKGFTLIEMLAVIIIIGILLTIAVPGISRYVKRGTDEYYHRLEDSLLLAGRDYLNDYRTLYPRKVGNVTVVELEELVSNQNIEGVVDRNGKQCQAKVIVRKKETDDYDYYSCLICEDYQTNGENCNYTEEDNVTPDSDYYRLEVDQDRYIVKQSEAFEVPKARAYYNDELVNNQIEGNPRIIDTNKLGTTTITYSYHGKKKSIEVEVVDQVKPSIPQIVLRYDNNKGNSYKGEWYRSNIYAEYKSTDYVKEGIVGSGISYYEISSDKEVWTKVNGNTNIHETTGEYTYYVRSVDRAGNTSEVNSYKLKIDKETPQCNITVIEGIEGKNNWYISDVTFGLNVTPTISGVSAKSISTEKIAIDTSGQTVTGSVTSGAGITGKCSTSVKIDKKTPEVPTITADDNISSGVWHKADITLKTSGSNSTSGITYYFDTNSNPTTMQSSIGVSGNIEGITYYAKACNGAGTCSNIGSYVAKIDKSTPSCEVVVTGGNLGSNGWYTSDVSLDLSIGKTISDITSQSLSAYNITVNTDGQTVTGNVTSGAGVIGTCSTVIKLDKTYPSIYAKSSDNYITTTTNEIIQNYFTVTTSISGGSTTCQVYSTGSLALGVNTVTCTVTSGSGLSSSNSTTFRHQYTASEHCRNGRTLSNGTCKTTYTNNESECGCKTRNSCPNGPACGYEMASCQNLDACGCAQYKCKLYSKCKVCKCSGWQTILDCDSSKFSDSCVHITGFNADISSYGRHSECGSETVYGEACAGASSKECVEVKSCQAAVCGNGPAKSCQNDSCTCAVGNDCTKEYPEDHYYSCDSPGNNGTNGNLNGTTCSF